MPTILEIIKLSAEYLEKKEVDSPRVTAEILLCHVLQCKRIDLYLAFDKPMQEAELEAYRSVLRERGNRKPVQYITGEAEFYGIRFKVNEATLIPRPETEILVESILQRTESTSTANILDIGTGSGCIAIALAKQLPFVTVTAVDKSAAALAVAAENAENAGVTERMRFVQLDILEPARSLQGPFDMVVSNPPYVPAAEYKALQPEILNHEPEDAVTDHADGYLFYRTITSIARDFLKPGGKLFYEVAAGAAPEIASMMREAGFTGICILKDLARIERIVLGELAP